MLNFRNSESIRVLVSSCLRSIVLLGALLPFSSCSPDAPATSSSAAALGTRTYKLDPEAAAISVAIYGVSMGTPDQAKFSFLMRALKNAGEFTSVIEKYPGIEGGITLCGFFSSTANREKIYELVRSIETDSKDTNLTATSVSNCGS